MLHMILMCGIFDCVQLLHKQQANIHCYQCCFCLTISLGVEVLSMQPRGTFRQTSFTKTSLSHPMPSISDEDITLENKPPEPPQERKEKVYFN